MARLAESVQAISNQEGLRMGWNDHIREIETECLDCGAVDTWEYWDTVARLSTGWVKRWVSTSAGPANARTAGQATGKSLRTKPAELSGRSRRCSLPPHPNQPGNRSWKRDASGKMVPDLGRQPTAMRPEGIPDTAKTRGGKPTPPRRGR